MITIEIFRILIYNKYINNELDKKIALLIRQKDYFNRKKQTSACHNEK